MKCGVQLAIGSAAVWENFLINSEVAWAYTDATDLSGPIMTFIHLGNASQR